jgi:hypothetical protein
MSHPALLTACALLLLFGAPVAVSAADGKAAAAERVEWTGTATKTASGLPILTVGDVRYRLKAAEGAPATVATAIAAIAKGEAEGKTYLAKGSEAKDAKGKSWITATELAEVVAPSKAP